MHLTEADPVAYLDNQRELVVGYRYIDLKTGLAAAGLSADDLA